MNIRNAHRTIFAAYFVFFLFLAYEAGQQGSAVALIGATGFGSLAGHMLWLSIFRPRH